MKRKKMVGQDGNMYPVADVPPCHSGTAQDWTEKSPLLAWHGGGVWVMSMGNGCKR